MGWDDQLLNNLDSFDFPSPFKVDMIILIPCQFCLPFPFK